MAVRFTLENLCKPSFRLRKQQKVALKLLQPEIMRSLLQDDILNAPREQFVWEALIEWLESSPHQQRSQFFEQLLDTIRIGLLPKKFVADHVRARDAIPVHNRTPLYIASPAVFFF
jgi:BTB And C-terminal Kelch